MRLCLGLRENIFCPIGERPVPRVDKGIDAPMIFERLVNRTDALDKELALSLPLLAFSAQGLDVLEIIVFRVDFDDTRPMTFPL